MNRYLILIMIALIIIASACSNSKRVSARRTDLNAQWVLLSIAGEKDPEKIYAETKTPELNFDTQKMTVTGNNGCNRLSGKYSFPQKERIAFGPFITTKMACPTIEDGEAIFMTALQKINSFSIEKDILKLRNGKEEIMRLVKKQ